MTKATKTLDEIINKVQQLADESPNVPVEITTLDLLSILNAIKTELLKAGKS